MPAEPSRLAIDLSGAVIRVVDGVMGGAMRPAAATLPDGSWSRGRPADPAVVGRAIKEILARNGIVGSRALVAVSDEIATFRVLPVDLADHDQQVAAVVAREMTLDPERLATRWIDLVRSDGQRLVYAASWDRSTLKDVTEAVRLAGLDPVVIELKSAALARAVTEAACVIVDLVGSPAEIVIVDDSIPQLWHGFSPGGPSQHELFDAVGSAVMSVIRFYQRKASTGFGAEAPVLLCTEQAVQAELTNGLAATLGRPVRMMPRPPRVPDNVRHEAYLACLGLMMRRDG